MSAIDKLSEKFRDFPGIGPRQAKRFVYFLLSRNRAYIDDLSRLLLEIKNEVHVCESCKRFFNGRVSSKTCLICSDQNRESEKLMIVEKDVDLDNIERSGAYLGNYFVLGGLLKILESEPEKKVRLAELIERIERGLNNKTPSEIILAFSLNAEGEHTTEFVESYIRSKLGDKAISYSHLGRGVSTGSEVEYLDQDTIKNAIKNRY